MSKALSSKHGNMLFQLLPEVYRSRDNARFDETGQVAEHGDLGNYVDSIGHLFDDIDNTLKQRLADCFPDQPEDGLACQSWLLPYFARLLDVNIVSPDEEGQRHEIANAVAWRQRKGTVQNAETIAETIGQLEMELQEAWQRVATTPRIGQPLMPTTALGEETDWNVQQMPAIEVAKHPGLPSVTVDFRKHSLAVRTDEENPVAEESEWNGQTHYWRRINPTGMPCSPNTYHDSSKRTVDLRQSDWKQGHYHPKRALMYVPHPAGFFVEDAAETTWNVIKAQGLADVVDFSESTVEVDGQQVVIKMYQGVGESPVLVKGNVILNDDAIVVFENLVFAGTVNVKKGRIDTVNCAISTLNVTTVWGSTPVWYAIATLVDQVSLKQGQCQLEFVTILGKTVLPEPLVSDCVFVKPIRKAGNSNDLPEKGCIRYSRVEEDDANLKLLPLYGPGCTTRQPLFFETAFGETSCGVLHPQTHSAIQFGAEDQGEMGAYHEHRLCLRFEAVKDKLQDYLPVGMEVVLIPDHTLHCPPPQPVN